MTPVVLVTDTHPIVWYLSGQFAKLSTRVRGAFDAAVAGGAAIWVPVVVLWEISLLVKAGKVRLSVPLDEYVKENFHAKAIHLVDLTPEDVVQAHELSFSPDPWDTMIVAVAQRLGCPLITRDSRIHEAGPCAVYWD